MAKHYSEELNEGLVDTFKFKAGDTISSQVAEIIQPVVALRPVLRQFAQLLSNATTVTIFTPETDFYLYGLQVSAAKDMVNNATNIAIRYTTPTTSFIRFELIPGLDQYFNETVMFPSPIKIPAGKSVKIETDNGTAIIKVSCILYGHY